MSSNVVVRKAVAGDRKRLAELETLHFPAFDSIFADRQWGTAALSLPDGIGFENHVATKDGAIIGFAVASPFSLPGNQGFLDDAMVLQYIAVADSARLLGVGTLLLQCIEEAALRRGSVVLLSHIAESAKDFFATTGWSLGASGDGFAWVQSTRHQMLLGDLPDPHIGYPYEAWKVLQPAQIADSFTFPRLSGAPIHDATVALASRMGSGLVKRRQLTQDALEQIEMLALQAPPPTRRGAFGQRRF